MRRLAFFVEGYSEMLFVERLVNEVAGAHNVVVEQIQIRGGAKAPRSVAIVQAAREAANEKYYVLIVDCGGDHQVKSRIMEEHDNLTRKGYEKIIGIRDVRPTVSREQIPDFKRGLNRYIKTSLAPVFFILSIMELEAWFLAEFNHYQVIDDEIKVEDVAALLSFDPISGDPSERDEPAADLNATYGLAGKSYEKSSVRRTVDALDFNYIYCDLKDRIPELRELTDHLDAFLTT